MKQTLPVKYAEYVQVCKELNVQPKSAKEFIELDKPVEAINNEIEILLTKASQKYLYSKMETMSQMGNGDFDSYVTDVDKQGVSKADIEENKQLIEYVAELNEKLDELRENLNTDELTEEQKDTKETLQSLKDDHSNYLEVIEKLKTQTTQVEGLAQAIGKVTSLNPAVSQVQAANVVQKAQLSKLPFWGDDVSEEQQSDLIRYLRELLQVENEQRDLDEDRNQELRSLTNKQEANSEILKSQTEDIRKANKKTSESLKDYSMRMLAHFKMSKKTQDSMMDLLATIAPLLILWGIGKLTEIFPGVTGRTDEKYEDTVGTLSPENQEYINEQVHSEENQKTVAEIMKGDLQPASKLGKIPEWFHNLAAALGLRSDYSTSSFYKDEKTGEYVIVPSTLVGEDGLTGKAVSTETVLKQLAATSIEDQASSGIYRFKSKKDLEDFMDLLEGIPKDAPRQERRESFGEALRKTNNNLWFDYDHFLFRSKRHPDGVETKQNNVRGVNPETGLTSYNSQPVVPDLKSELQAYNIAFPISNIPKLEDTKSPQQREELVVEHKQSQPIVNHIIVNNYNQQYTQSQDPNQTTT